MNQYNFRFLNLKARDWGMSTSEKSLSNSYSQLVTGVDGTATGDMAGASTDVVLGTSIGGVAGTSTGEVGEVAGTSAASVLLSVGFCESLRTQ